MLFGSCRPQPTNVHRVIQMRSCRPHISYKGFTVYGRTSALSHTKVLLFMDSHAAYDESRDCPTSEGDGHISSFMDSGI